MKKRLVGSILLGLCLALGCAVPAMADSRKVVTLGADLTQAQKDTMMRYFGVSYDSVDIIYINNTDEREHLGACVPLEQIGNYTYSCALVAPTTSGGIQVKTANLSWVTCNMIASTLSTSGVTNCQVVAACPFQVSGTGALTGVIMAYEDASQETLDPVKVELANEELVTTGNLANEVGASKATAVINETKTQVIENNITNVEEITNVIQEVSNQYDVDISNDQSEQISALMQRIAEQEYDITQLKATLDRVQANVAGDAGASEEAQQKAEEQAQASEQAALEAAQQQQLEELLESGQAVEDENGVVIVDDMANWDNEENILENTDVSALEDAGATVEEVDTTQTVQEQMEEETDEESWDSWDLDISDLEDLDGTVMDGVEIWVEDADPEELEEWGLEFSEDGELDAEGIEMIPEESVPEESVPESDEQTAPAEDAAQDVTEAPAPETDAEVLPEAALTPDDLDEENRLIYDDIASSMGMTFATAVISSEDGSAQVYLSENGAKQVPEKVEQYLLKVMTEGAQNVAMEEAADPAIDQNIVQDTADSAPDKAYTDEDVAQIDKYVRRLVFKDAEKILEDSYLEETDKPVLYNVIMGIVEDAYHVEIEEDALLDMMDAEGLDDMTDGAAEEVTDDVVDGTVDELEDISDEWAELPEDYVDENVEGFDESVEGF